MLIINPLIAYGVERATRVEPAQLVRTERVVAPKFDDATTGVREPTGAVVAGRERRELLRQVVAPFDE
jgi:hypothetical protein